LATTVWELAALAMVVWELELGVPVAVSTHVYASTLGLVISNISSHLETTLAANWDACVGSIWQMHISQ
jgi:hypothetical protein